MVCKDKFNSQFQNIQIILNPIKCVYSADYHAKDEVFIFSSGAFSKSSFIHEFIHHVIHPIIERRKEEILHCNIKDFRIDSSYYLDGGEYGKLNAFEEYMVRKFTDKFLTGDIPENLDVFFENELINIGIL